MTQNILSKIFCQIYGWANGFSLPILYIIRQTCYCSRRWFGVFTIYKTFPEILVGMQMDTTSWIVPVKNYRKKRNFCKGSPVFLVGPFRMEICVPLTCLASFITVSDLWFSQMMDQIINSAVFVKVLIKLIHEFPNERLP